MNVKIEVTWEDGRVTVYDSIPVSEYERLGEDAVKRIIEAKTKKKIKSIKRVDKPAPAAPAQGGREPAGQTDRDSSSQTPPADNTAKPVVKNRNPHYRDEEPDYRDKFPDKYTPQGMRRNKWGELIWE